MHARELIEVALKLQASERQEIVDELLHSLDSPDSEIDRLWTDEAEARLAAYRRGELSTVPMEAVFRKP